MGARDALLEISLSTPHLSVVIPAFNEEQRIGTTLKNVVTYLSEQPYSWEVVVVDDGSSDGTARLARERAGADNRIRVESIPHAGKGWAVRTGMLAARGRYRFMCDADLAMPIEQLGSFLQQMENGYDIVVGSREIAGARRFDEPVGRHLMGRAFNRLVRWVAVSGFEDTQCGFKCFRGDVAEDLFRRQRTRGWAFDVEILLMAVKSGLRVLELPIDWHHHQQSKVRPVIDSFSMTRETIVVRLRYLRGKYQLTDRD